MTTKVQGRAMRPTHPHIALLSPETARDIQDNDLCRPCGWSVEFAEIVDDIVRGDGHLTLSDLGEGGLHD